ncbi:MAG: glycogen synthase GlgA [Gammaproteobacteria bacterium]
MTRRQSKHVLFATSEAHPLIKIGGLGDVSGSLPVALKCLGCDVRMVLPAYRQVLAHAGRLARVAELTLPDTGDSVRVLHGTLDGDALPYYLIDAPLWFDRPGGPYTAPGGQDWPDNAERFAAFSRGVVELAMARADRAWDPQVVHCNDWPTGLVPALLAREAIRPATVFTIHNLAYQGLFDRDTFARLRLPYDLWTPEGVEFYGRFSFIKGGLAFADLLNTVSPTYASEIQRPEFGFGLDGLLRYRAEDLRGILNGADYAVWDPRCDPQIVEPYDAGRLERKYKNRQALQRHFGLPEAPEALLLGAVTRLAEQKGVDLILGALGSLRQDEVQVVVLGSGDPHLERALMARAREHADRLAVFIGHDEALAHRIVAGVDAFLMPSRYEPCGLGQMYSLRYGTIPIVHRTGGLADSVIDATPEAIAARTATGVSFTESNPIALADAIRRAQDLYRDRNTWRQMQRTGMAQDFSWKRSAEAYRALYAHADSKRQRLSLGA